jgi:thiol:disulfide interchange protein DsbC
LGHQWTIEGLYEVVAGANVMYFDPKGMHLVIGSILDGNGKDLTAEARNKVAAGNYEIFRKSLDLGVRVGIGRHVVVEIIDPDCPYCRKMAPFWANRKDVTRYVFLTPLPMHKDSPKKIAFILSAPDPSVALEEVLSGKYDNATLPIFKHNDKRLAEVAKVMAASGIRSTPSYYVDGIPVTGANTAAIVKILDAPQKGGK